LGRRSYTYPDGTRYEGEWKGKKRHGHGVWTRPDGTKYVGDWENDKPSGDGTLTKPDGTIYTGEWKEGRRQGYGVLTRPDGTRKVGEWRDGKYIGHAGHVSEGLDKERDSVRANLGMKEKSPGLEGDKFRRQAKRFTAGYLKRFNFIMGILHLAQGSAMLYFALTIDQISAFRTPVRSSFLEFNTEIMRLVTRTDQLWEVPFAMFVSFFLLLSALAHFIIVMPKTNRIYNRDLEKGINKFRWYEYALSSSLMIILIAMLFGVYDIGALIAIFILNASMNLFGLLMEKLNQHTEKTDWSPFVFGTIAGIGPWIVIILHALGNADPAEVPWFVYAIIGSYFLFFNLFPINMILQYKKVGRWADYLYGERGYIILSLAAKSVLAWLVFFGVMQPS
jgi:hypothetical protein